MRHSIIFPSLLLLARNVRAGCYFPDGTLDKNVEYQPCSEDSSNPLSSICCATNRKDGADICAPNGLCQVGRKKGSPPAQAAWTKPSCTNQDWSEDGCLHVCGTDKYPFLTPCNRAAGNESQRWCCGMTQNCCNEDAGLSIEYLPITFDPSNFTDASLSPSSSSSSSSSSASSKPTPSATKAPSPSADAHTHASSPSQNPTETPAPGPPPSTGLSTGAKVGLGIGIALAALAFLGLGILWGRRRNKASAHSFDPVSEADAAPLEKYARLDRSMGGASAEGSVAAPPATPRKDEGMEIQVQVHEMPVWESRGELDGREMGGFLGKGKETYA
ncbi:hypothetical protein P171DRAFT_478655 [Karstenula rhodostoma CBS 690.94]|uniref:Mid2 domain-containing protein n=1 Tax=Karstenula rhodostoma CBS 690.94 TaxID=1392251 RepID=A0A9P4PYG3_9PLEO|nr:hypothetical protein P171DRAFT_478655 [Karstenula rhodostoma CBS 690.94]